jgi:hypothetical protein
MDNLGHPLGTSLVEKMMNNEFLDEFEKMMEIDST